MRHAVLTIMIVAGMAIWLPAAPAVAADPALTLLLQKGLISREEYEQAEKTTGSSPALTLMLGKGLITQAEYEQARKDAERPVAGAVSREAPPQVAQADSKPPDKASDTIVDLGKSIKFGYDRGLYMRFKDKFQLKIRIRGQFRFTDSHVNTAYGTVGDPHNYPLVSGAGVVTSRKIQEGVDEFVVKRTRLVFEGFAFNPDLNYFIQFRNDTNGSTTQPGTARSTTQLYDAYITARQIAWANLRVGQYRTHFGRQEFVSSALLQFVDRGFVAEAFVPNVIDRRDQGVTVFSDPAKYPLNYAFGVFNGVGINLTRLGLNTPGNANELMYVGRVTADLMGKPTYPEGDLGFSRVPQVGVGASYGYNGGLQTNTTGASSNNQVSTAIASLGNGRLLNQGIVDVGTTGVDVVFKYRGLSLQAEGFVRNVNTHDHSKRIGHATGYYVQGGYFILPGTLEVVGRWSAMDPDTQATQDLLTSGVGGLNWYFSGHEHKLQADYGVITTRLSAPDVGGAASLIENRFRLQYTIVF
jgi:hypothetical protein